MARPRKDSETPAARERIIDAFWMLLETTPLKKITAGLVAEEAHCNRGTFYYHFDSMDALVYEAISELMDDGMLVQVTFFMDMDMQEELDALHARIADGTSPLVAHLDRFALIMGTGEMRTIDTVAKQVILDAWRALLCPEGGDLEPETQVIIKTMVGGTLTFLASECERETPLGPPDTAMRAFLAGRAQNALTAIAAAQHVSQEEIRSRMAARWHSPAACEGQASSLVMGPAGSRAGASRAGAGSSAREALVLI